MGLGVFYCFGSVLVGFTDVKFVPHAQGQRLLLPNLSRLRKAQRQAAKGDSKHITVNRDDPEERSRTWGSGRGA